MNCFTASYYLHLICYCVYKLQSSIAYAFEFEWINKFVKWGSGFVMIYKNYKQFIIISNSRNLG